MRDMAVIAEQQSQGVLARCELNFGRRAAVPEVHMLVVSRYRQPGRRKSGIDQQVVMT